MLVEILQGSDGSSGVEVGLGHAAVGELDGVLVLPLVAVLKRRNAQLSSLKQYMLNKHIISKKARRI